MHKGSQCAGLTCLSNIYLIGQRRPRNLQANPYDSPALGTVQSSLLCIWTTSFSSSGFATAVREDCLMAQLSPARCRKPPPPTPATMS